MYMYITPMETVPVIGLSQLAEVVPCDYGNPNVHLDCLKHNVPHYNSIIHVHVHAVY